MIYKNTGKIKIQIFFKQCKNTKNKNKMDNNEEKRKSSIECVVQAEVFSIECVVQVEILIAALIIVTHTRQIKQQRSH